MKILLIEEQELILKTLGDFLEALGHQVWTAQTVSSLLSNGHPADYGIDVVILDLGSADGKAMVKLKQLHSRFPAADILLTNRVKLDVLSVIDNGVIAFFSKPPRLAELDFILARINEKRGSERKQGPA